MGSGGAQLHGRLPRRQGSPRRRRAAERAPRAAPRPQATPTRGSAAASAATAAIRRSASLWASSAALVRVDGWVSRGAARQMDRWATADAAMYYLTPPPRDSRAADRVEPGFAPSAPRRTLTRPTPRRPSTTRARRLVDAVESRRTSATTEHNLSVVCRLPSVSRKLAGIVASLLSYYKRAIGAEVERRAAAASQHVGTVGERSSSRSRSSASETIGVELRDVLPPLLRRRRRQPGEVVLLGEVARHAGRHPPPRSSRGRRSR